VAPGFLLFPLRGGLPSSINPVWKCPHRHTNLLDVPQSNQLTIKIDHHTSSSEMAKRAQAYPAGSPELGPLGWFEDLHSRVRSLSLVAGNFLCSTASALKSILVALGTPYSIQPSRGTALPLYWSCHNEKKQSNSFPSMVPALRMGLCG
jgi:hypothetical protein